MCLRRTPSPSRRRTDLGLSFCQEDKRQSSRVSSYKCTYKSQKQVLTHTEKKCAFMAASQHTAESAVCSFFRKSNKSKHRVAKHSSFPYDTDRGFQCPIYIKKARPDCHKFIYTCMRGGTQGAHQLSATREQHQTVTGHSQRSRVQVRSSLSLIFECQDLEML